MHILLSREMDGRRNMESTSSILFTAKRPDILMEKGRGMFLWDTEGKRYLDFVGGWAVTCLGHCPDVLRDTLARQADTLINASPSYFNRPMLSFADMLTRISGFDKVFFASTGAEANEGAVKLARKYGSLKKAGAFEIITTINSFHGRTLAMMSATGKKQWNTLFAPKVPGFIHVPFNDLEAVQAALTPNTCAIMLEPVQGEGGVHPASERYLAGLRALCDQENVLLVYDEIQTGIGRTGKLFAFEHSGVRPDILTLAKGLGGGYPISAMLTTDALDIFEPGDQGGSYCAQPLGMAVGEAVVSEVIHGGWVENARIMGEYLTDCLVVLGRHLGTAPNGTPFIRNIRGKGLLVAFDLPDETGACVVETALQEGLLINTPQPATIRLMPPLVVERSHVEAMIHMLCHVLVKCHPPDSVLA
jgi:acetylornithine/N-succinyldiaminopimelate aminotransferase